jgi:hypothetical protein
VWPASNDRLRRLGSPRRLSALLGVWLFVSTFVFSQTYERARVAWVLGALIAGARHPSGLLALLLCISSLVLPAASGWAELNGVGVAGAVFFLSVWSIRRGAPTPRREEDSAPAPRQEKQRLAREK